MRERKYGKTNFYSYLGRGYILRWFKKNNIRHTLGIKSKASGKYKKKIKI